MKKLYNIGGENFLVVAEQRFVRGRFITLTRKKATVNSTWMSYNGEYKKGARGSIHFVVKTYAAECRRIFSRGHVARHVRDTLASGLDVEMGFHPLPC